LDEEAVRILAVGQHHGTDVDTLLSETAGKRLRRFLAAAVRIGIKGQIYGSPTVAELTELARIQIRA